MGIEYSPQRARRNRRRAKQAREATAVVKPYPDGSKIKIHKPEPLDARHSTTR
jgi:hypothetical protein